MVILKRREWTMFGLRVMVRLLKLWKSVGYLNRALISTIVCHKVKLKSSKVPAAMELTFWLIFIMFHIQMKSWKSNWEETARRSEILKGMLMGLLNGKVTWTCSEEEEEAFHVIFPFFVFKWAKQIPSFLYFQFYTRNVH